MTECSHKEMVWDGPDPSVGIFGYLVGCAICGAEALEFTEVYDEEPYDGLIIGFDVAKWGKSEAEQEEEARMDELETLARYAEYDRRRKEASAALEYALETIADWHKAAQDALTPVGSTNWKTYREREAWMVARYELASQEHARRNAESLRALARAMGKGQE